LSATLASDAWGAEDLAYCKAALAMFGQHRERDQVPLLTRCLETGDLSPANRAAALINRGYALNAIHQYRRAIADLDEALRLQPKSAESLNYRGRAKAFMGDDAGAMADLDRAVALDPTYAAAYANRGIANEAEARHEKAIADLDKALKIDGEQSEALLYRGIAKRYLGRLDEALADLNHALKLDPEAPNGYTHRGWTLYGLGHYDLAIIDFRAALERDADNPYKLLHLAIALLKNGGDNVRREIAERAKTVSPHDWPAPLIFVYLGRTSEDVALAAAREGPADGASERTFDAYFFLGMRRLVEGDRKGAADFLRKSLETDKERLLEFRQAKLELAKLK
jgi:lipoprotein NlpI